MIKLGGYNIEVCYSLDCGLEFKVDGRSFGSVAALTNYIYKDSQKLFENAVIL